MINENGAKTMCFDPSVKPRAIYGIINLLSEKTGYPEAFLLKVLEELAMEHAGEYTFELLSYFIDVTLEHDW